MSGARQGARAARLGVHACAPDAQAGAASPPSSDTGVEITVHWLRGGFHQPVEDVLELVNELTVGGYGETLDYGRFMYSKQHRFVGGLTVFVGPKAPNMAPVLVECPGAACEFLGWEKLKVLFCNAELSRVDVAFDGAPFSPKEMVDWTRRGDIRTRARVIRFHEKIRGGDEEGDSLTIGSRSSEQFLRAYDRRGFTRIELEFKESAARAFKAVLLSEPEEFRASSIGALRQFVDFVDASSASNISRAGLLPLWEAFTEGLARVKIRVGGSVLPTCERVVQYIEHQAAATLYVYQRLGYSVSALLKLGAQRLRSRHRSVLAFAGASGG